MLCFHELNTILLKMIRFLLLRKYNCSHELAALLLTETIQHSLYNLKEPIFVIYLDAKSAFDVVLPELLVKNLYHCGTDEKSLLMINNRLTSRSTCLEWNKELAGPINDEQGVEQGGVNSGEFYKIFGKEQLENAQLSCLGVPLYDLVISGIGQADDTGLVSNHPQFLMNLLRLSLNFCSKYQVELCPEKTKLQVFSTKSMSHKVEYLKSNSEININGTKIKYVQETEHVGITRSTTGNLPHILGRVIAHKQALGAVLHSGLARAHRDNAAAGLKVAKLHALTVLLSGNGEIDILD